MEVTITINDPNETTEVFRVWLLGPDVLEAKSDRVAVPRSVHVSVCVTRFKKIFVLSFSFGYLDLMLPPGVQGYYKNSDALPPLS